MQYKIKVHIIGSPWRPPYTGNVIVNAENLTDAIRKTIGKLRKTTFFDVPVESFRILKTDILN